MGNDVRHCVDMLLLLQRKAALSCFFLGHIFQVIFQLQIFIKTQKCNMFDIKQYTYFNLLLMSCTSLSIYYHL